MPPTVEVSYIRRRKLSCSMPRTFFGRFRFKDGIVLEEADESLFWLELLMESGIATHEKLGPLLQESDELVSIFVASLRTAKGIGYRSTMPDLRPIDITI